MGGHIGTGGHHVPAPTHLLQQDPLHGRVLAVSAVVRDSVDADGELRTALLDRLAGEQPDGGACARLEHFQDTSQCVLLPQR